MYPVDYLYNMPTMLHLFSHKRHPEHPIYLTDRTPSTRRGLLARTALALLLLLMPLRSHAQWKAYLAYSDPTEIERASGGVIYVLASGDLYSYDTGDHSLQTYDKSNALSDCGIEHIAWCQQAHRLVVCYTDYNIDLLEANGNVVNIADYMNKTMTYDKTVYDICIDGPYAYLSTGFGIVKVNVANGEIADTYQLGFKVNYSYVKDGFLYAASQAQGMYRAPLTANLLDPNQWTRTGSYVWRKKTLDEDLLATVKTLSPGGPKTNNIGFLKLHGGKLYTCNGRFSTQDGSIQVLSQDNWTIYQDDISQTTGRKYVDITALDVDPKNSNHVMAAARNGLYEFNDGKFVAYYDCQNSPIESFNNKDMEYQLVTGVKYDTDGNLWLLNSQAPTQSIIERTASGEWVTRGRKELMGLDADGFTNKSLGDLKGMMIDSRGLMWFVNNNYVKPSFYAYDFTNNGMNSYTSFVNQDYTETTVNAVRCVAEDQDGNIWIGTNQGPFMLETTQMSQATPILTQVKVPRNDGTNYADYLLAGVDITACVIDGANRKWFGTNGSGVYLIASNNITQLQHFTKSNSPLLSDNILALAMDNNTGELFIGTDNGLCSYTAPVPSGDGMTKDNVYAYPNPVRPDYQGAITITGLDEDADVKILTANGALVSEGRASGGQYKWYGLDRDGRRVASGVYMVAVATAEGEKGVVCKVAIIN